VLYNRDRLSLNERPPLEVVFFMDNLIIIPSVETKKENMSLKPKPVVEPKPIKLDKVKLSDNIQKFDNKVRKDPFSYNNISLNKKEPLINPTLSARQLITNATYNKAAEILGVDNVREWGVYSRKVQEIVDWAKTKSKLEGDELVNWIYNRLQKTPQITDRRINDLYIVTKL
jgi:hypothetical protein